MKIPSEWVKSDGVWQLGLKRAYELWPKDLVTRITKERKREFMIKHHEYEAETQKDIAKLDTIKKLSEEQKDLRKELEDRIAAITALRDSYEDKGPVHDCIVYKPTITTELDKTAITHLPWAVIDTTDDGDLSSLSPMNAYHHTQQYGVFSNASLMSFSFNFYDDDILSISAVSGTHGTHVAGIIAAHHPEQPELNGVAPGAQIMSFTIGDGRLGSMETSQSFMRAMNFAIKFGADIINISYGEDSHIANHGPLMDYMRDIVIRKHKITVVSSAGNNGPGYSTIGAPGGMTSSVISVGAYVSKEMAAAQYALRDEAGDSAYTWSSRGPSIDGDKGVSIFAPGGAITCVPPYALNHAQLMNGTSMSSPNAAGGIALILSGLRAKATDYTPGSISRSLLRTSTDIGDEFKTGLLNVASAFEDLLEGDGLGADTYFDISINGSKRGIVIREAGDLASPQVYNVEIKPRFQEADTQKQFDFEMFLALEAQESWIDCAQHLHLNNTGRATQVKIDTAELKAGLYVTSIKARSTVSNKVVFEIPVTVVKPIPSSSDEVKHVTFDMKFKPGKINRQYLQVPAGVQGCTIHTSTQDVSTPIQLWTHVTQFAPDTRRTWTSTPFVQNFTSSAGAETAKKVVRLRPGSVEFCFAQFWNSVAESSARVSVKVEFHGVHGDYGSVLQLDGGNGYKQIVAKSAVGTEELKPSVRLEMLRKHLRPTSSLINSLGSRDVLEDSTRLYSMALQYSIKITRSGESKFLLPMSGTLYENAWYSTLIQVFDEKKNLVYFTSTYPEKHKFEKQTYTILIELVHKDRGVLEKMKDQLISVESAIEKEITMDIYDNFLNLWNKSDAKLKPLKLSLGDSKSFVVSECIEVPKEAAVGDLLVGSIMLNDHKELKMPVSYRILPAAVPKKEDEKPKTLLELQIEMASKIPDAEEKQKYLADLSLAHPTDLQIKGAHLEHCKEEEKEYIANSIVDLIDADAVAKYFGVTRRPASDQSDAEKDEAKEMKRRKKLLGAAYAAKLNHITTQLKASSSAASLTAANAAPSTTSTILSALTGGAGTTTPLDSSTRTGPAAAAAGDSSRPNVEIGSTGHSMLDASTDADHAAARKATEEALESYMHWTASASDTASSASATCLLTQSRARLVRGQHGTSLNLALRAFATGDLSAAEHVTAREVRVACFDGLGWSAWSHKEREDRIGMDPDDYRSF